MTSIMNFLRGRINFDKEIINFDKEIINFYKEIIRVCDSMLNHVQDNSNWYMYMLASAE